MKTLSPILFALCASRLAAQPVAPLTLEECLQLGASQHPAHAAARAGVAAATEAIGEAQAPLFPQLDITAGYHRWQRRAFLPAGLTLPGRPLPELIGPLDDWNGALTSRFLLFDSGERRASVDAAKARRAGAEAEATSVVADVRLNVHLAFFALAAAADVQLVAAKNLERAEAHQQLAAARHAAGAVAQADVLRAQAETATARLQVINAANRVRIAAGRLNTAMGRPAETPLAFAPPPRSPPSPVAAPLDHWLQRALAHRPELAAGEKRTEAARAAVNAARATRAPKIRADAAFGWRDTVLLPDTREWQAGVAIDLPIFDAGTRSRRLARTQSELTREEALLAARRLQVRDEVWSAHAEQERAWAAIAANESSVRAHEESLRVTRERYELGAAVITDLLDNQAALARAEGSHAEARWSYFAARAAFERAVGGTP